MKIQTSTKFNILMTVIVLLGALGAIQALKEVNRLPKETAHFSSTQVSEMVAKCYADNLAPVIKRDKRGNVIELTCKEKN